jgi:5-formyltetrahydrofolate cyclo-ligase
MLLVDTKESMRSMIWDTMEEEGIAGSYCHGRIPDFNGSRKAAKMLRNTSEWKNASTIFVSPDTAQRSVRENAFYDKKLLIMASPKLLNGYLLLEPSNIVGHEKEASTIEGAFKYGSKIEIFSTIDIVVEGSVAVDMNGGRLGKGGGYGDVEISYLKDQMVINVETPVVSTVHEIQVVEKVPTEQHDQKINMIITPERVLRVKHWHGYENKDL